MGRKQGEKEGRGGVNVENENNVCLNRNKHRKGTQAYDSDVRFTRDSFYFFFLLVRFDGLDAALADGPDDRPFVLFRATAPLSAGGSGADAPEMSAATRRA